MGHRHGRPGVDHEGRGSGARPSDKRGTAYGIFNTGYGLCWFAGSVAIGVMYDISIWYVVVFSVALQLLSIPVFLLMKRAG